MRTFYRIRHNGEEIAVADTLDQVMQIVRDSRPGTYSILEVRGSSTLDKIRLTRSWGTMIHPDDGHLILSPLPLAESESPQVPVEI